jgi:hypothetical protein
MYASRATEFGRGNKVTKFSDAPDWTPSPNAYFQNLVPKPTEVNAAPDIFNFKTDFVSYVPEAEVN